MKKRKSSRKTNGFTLVELLMVIAVIAILSVLVYTAFGGSRERTYRSRADAEFTTMHNALKLYVEKYNAYPNDVERNVPAGLKEFIRVDNDADNWPNGPWPGSVYDYDRHTIDGEDTIQISIRFCPISGPSDLSDCSIPEESWAEGFNRNSSLYYCIKGNCRAHSSQPASYPGFCVNCPDNKAIGT